MLIGATKVIHSTLDQRLGVRVHHPSDRYCPIDPSVLTAAESQTKTRGSLLFVGWQCIAKYVLGLKRGSKLDLHIPFQEKALIAPDRNATNNGGNFIASTCEMQRMALHLGKLVLKLRNCLFDC